ncbi:uncharacterized protein LOC117486343 [Trematomus bernacchii]|uniref:uncharacterized protein LOC117486343 n=1 Tax=Trematomus bernacchii TaxID=40690 RepID=UPI00146EB8BE|nr:uncharacterized protein LOC117486343 [Trematomus bernacchii]
MADICARKEVFSWTDDEVELLLRVTLEYKTSLIQENVDWESCKLKYSDIDNLFQAQYPRTDTGKDFPHSVGAITKAQLAAKLKQIRIKYRHAVDTKRWSGQGRVVHMFFELCEEVWGGSPATCSLSSGIETGDLEELSSGPSSPRSLERSNDSPPPESSESNGSLPAAAVVQHRRNLLQVQLNGHRSDRLKKKLPVDHAVQEDLKLKRRMVELMEQNQKTSTRNAESFVLMNANIREGFSLMREFMHAQPHSSIGGQLPEQSPYLYRRPQPAYTPSPSAPHPSAPHRHTRTPDPPRQPSQYSYSQSLFEEDC